MIQKIDTSMIIDTARSHETWCIYEYQAQFAADKPPEVIMVGSCKLGEVYGLADGNRNSEWQRIYRNGGYVMVRIIGMGTDRDECRREAIRHMRSFETMPVCNIRGINMKGVSRPVECSNGKVYASQKEAAMDLGINASAISRHLKNELSHVGGHTFEFVRPQ